MSKTYIGAYVNFQGQAREAMEFYHKALGGTLDLQTVTERGERRPAGPGDSIGHALLEAGGSRIMASDGHPNFPAKVGENMGIAISGTDDEHVTRIFNSLAEGGKVKMQLAAQPWGGKIGYLDDKFGITWMITVDKA